MKGAIEHVRKFESHLNAWERVNFWKFIQNEYYTRC